MKITIDRGPLLRVLNHVQSVVEKRGTIPILSNILLVAERDTLTVTATDLDLEIREPVPASVAAPGKVTVAAGTLYDIARKLPDGSQVEMTLQNNVLEVVAGRSRFRLTTLPFEDFPVIAAGEFQTRIKMPAEELSRMLARVRYAISSEETRYYLMGVFFHSLGDSLLAVSTDGHRLARVSNDKPEDLGDVPGVIIPRKCVAEILKIIDDIEGNILIEMSATKARFSLGEAVLTTKLIDGTFPDYNRVIPTNNTKIATVSAASLAEAIDRVSTIASERTRAVKMDLARDKITLTVTSSEHGRAVEEIAAAYDGEPLEIGFNARYFLDVLLQSKDKDIEMAFDTPASPVVIRPKGAVSDLAVLMPMRV